jgi:hypothetical protein
MHEFPTTGGARAGVTARDRSRAPLRLRLRVRLQRRRLNNELAAGFDPHTSDELALRARQLTDRSTRRRVARSLRGVVSDVEDRRAAVLGSGVPVCRKVLPWREGLLGLAERLDGRDPVNASGVARTLLVLTDGSGPIYNPAARRSIGEAVWWIAEGLQLSPTSDAVAT